MESADSKPTDSAYAVFEDLSRRLDEQIAALDEAVSKDLVAFNELISSKGLAPVDAGDRPPTPK